MKQEETQLDSERFMENLLAVLPCWHGVIVKNFKQSLSGKMSLESYYCLQLLRHSGAITMSELAERLRISRQQATQMIQRLYEYQFVRRIQDESDRRCVKIEITARARAYIDHTFHRDTGFLETLERSTNRENMLELARAIEILLRVLPDIESGAKSPE